MSIARRTFLGLMAGLFGARAVPASDPVQTIKIEDVSKRRFWFVDRGQVNVRVLPPKDSPPVECPTLTFTESELRESLKNGTRIFDNQWSPRIRVFLPGGRSRWFDYLYGGQK